MRRNTSSCCCPAHRPRTHSLLTCGGRAGRKQVAPCPRGPLGGVRGLGGGAAPAHLACGGSSRGGPPGGTRTALGLRIWSAGGPPRGGGARAALRLRICAHGALACRPLCSQRRGRPTALKDTAPCAWAHGGRWEAERSQRGRWEGGPWVVGEASRERSGVSENQDVLETQREPAPPTGPVRPPGQAGEVRRQVGSAEGHGPAPGPPLPRPCAL